MPRSVRAAQADVEVARPVVCDEEARDPLVGEPVRPTRPDTLLR
ncbi:hypothetical protein [Umezawaea tangerina]|nr:hypothetical protein [Umezawaea tangerina]